MTRYIKYAATSLFAAFVFLYASAEEDLYDTQGRKTRFAYDLGAQTRFENTEYGSHGDFVPSETLFGIRADAAVGLKFDEKNTKHRILGGISALYDFGGGWRLQPLLYYKLDTHLKNSRFRLVAGAFSRNESRAYYSPALFSSYNRYIDATYEGIQFSWEAEKYYFELGCDWMGMISVNQPAIREEFKIYSGGYYNATNWLTVAYAGYLHHYANSVEAGGVVDDAVLNPYLDFEFASFVPLQSLLVRAGILAGYQNDRRTGKGATIPVDGNIYIRIKKWNVIIDNDLYFGNDLMPLYSTISPEGSPYGSHLYMSEPILRHRHGEAFGYFNRLGIAYEPHIAEGLSLQLRVNFDFNQGFLGSQQIIQVAYHF